MASITRAVVCIATWSLAVSVNPEIRMEQILRFVELNSQVIANQLVPGDHAYSYDADNHIADGGGMYSGNGGNYVSFGYDDTTVIENVMYNSSGSVGPIAWKNSNFRYFTQVLRVSNRNDTTINKFFLKINGTLAQVPSNMETYTTPDEFSFFLPCNINFGYASISLEENPGSSFLFMFFGESGISDVGLNLKEFSSEKDYEITYEVVGNNPGDLIEGYFVYFLISLPDDRSALSFGLPVVPILPSLIKALCVADGAERFNGCLNGYPTMNSQDFTLDGCSCIDGWGGENCDEARTFEKDKLKITC